MSHHHRATAALIFALMSITACSSNKEKPHPTKLISPLKSYESLSEVKSDLHLKNNAWQVLEDRKPLISDTRPEFKSYVIALPAYFHHGVEGRLVLHFYNDRLMRTQFFPKDIEAFRSALAREDSLVFNDQQETLISPATKVWIGKDADGAQYVGWVDKNLKAQMDDWIKKYS